MGTRSWRRNLRAAFGAPVERGGDAAAEWRWRRCVNCGLTFLGAQDRCLACREGLTVVREEDEEAAARPVLTREALLARAGRTVGEVMAEFRSSGRYIQARAAEWGVEIVDGVIKAPEAPAEKWPVGKDRLRELYVDEAMGARQIAERLGTTESAVKNALTRYGIRRRPGRPARAEGAEASAGDVPARVVVAIKRTDTPEECAPVFEHLRVMLQELAPLVRRVQVEIKVEAAG